MSSHDEQLQRELPIFENNPSVSKQNPNHKIKVHYESSTQKPLLVREQLARKPTMKINLNQPENWNSDTARSVDMYNDWFMNCAPDTFRSTRILVTSEVETVFDQTNGLIGATPEFLLANPRSLRTFRMSCCPPLAVDRLVGLAGVPQSLVKRMEKGKLPRVSNTSFNQNVAKLLSVLTKMLDHEIFVWIEQPDKDSPENRLRAATIIADRLTGADANPILRNAQEKRQLDKLAMFLETLGYTRKQLESGQPIEQMPTGTYAFHVNVPCTKDDGRPLNVSIDAVIQRHKAVPGTALPILIEAKSAGDFTNTNKRRKEESDKIGHLRRTFGAYIPYYLFLNGYFDSGYLGYEAAAGIDWVWEHRMEDLLCLDLEA